MNDEWKLPPYIMEQPSFFPLTQVVDWGVADMGVPDLWPEFGKGEGVKVAVLDTGLPTHRDLIEAIGKSKDFTGSARDVKDMQGHSTHCCGIVGARNNEIGTVGVAPMCEFLIGKVLGDNGSGNSRGIVAGIEWAVSMGADIISMSLGSPQPSPDILAAINRIPANVILVCAAGNAGPGESWDYPGAWDRSLSVASINQARQVSRFSSRNAQVDIAAPGEKIASCYLDDQTAVLSGTSMATPYIAGLAALCIGFVRRSNRPALSHERFFALLTETADDIGPQGPDVAAGYGIASPKMLLNRIKGIPPVTPIPPPPPPPPPPIGILQPGTYTLEAGTYTLNNPNN